MRQAMDTAEKLKKLMHRLGIRSQTKFARRLGYPNLSSIQRYFDATRGASPIPREMMNRMKEKIEGDGCPPVTVTEIFELGGISALTESEQTHSLGGQNTSIITGHYIPVLSIVDAMNMTDLGKEGRDAISPLEYIFNYRQLGEDECAIRLPNDSMAPTLPAGSVAIIKLGAALEPGNIAFLKVTDADGHSRGEIRRYKLRGYSHGVKLEKFEADSDAYPGYETGPDAAVPAVELVGRVIRVIITVEC
jgi:phage repressor protein C with HTH and peptisase S24 domain